MDEKVLQLDALNVFERHAERLPVQGQSLTLEPRPLEFILLYSLLFQVQKATSIVTIL